MNRFLLAFLLSAPLACPSGLFWWGAKVGTSANDAFKTARSGSFHYATTSHRLTYGPMVELSLPFNLGVEADLLYRRMSYEGAGNLDTYSLDESTSMNSWDVPILLKWRSGTGPARWFLSAGPTFRGLTQIKARIEHIALPEDSFVTTTNKPPALQNRFNTGLTLGAGLEGGAPRARVAVELRFTRWGLDNFRDVSGLLRTGRNQLDLMVGVAF